MKLGRLHFRYYWLDFNVESEYGKIGNIPSTWDAIKSGGIKVLFNKVVSTVAGKTVNKAWSIVQDIGTIFGNTPHLITVDTNNEWIKGKAAGTMYLKQIVIEDTDDKVKGNSYYVWGYISYVEYKILFDYKCCTNIINGHKIYEPFNKSSQKVTIKSENYDDSMKVFDNTIECYNLPTNHTTYYESLDLQKVIPKFQ